MKSQGAAAGDEEFGDDRLIAAIQDRSGLSAGEILDSVLGTVQHFSAGVQSNDLTLMIAIGNSTLGT